MIIFLSFCVLARRQQIRGFLIFRSSTYFLGNKWENSHEKLQLIFFYYKELPLWWGNYFTFPLKLLNIRPLTRVEFSHGFGMFEVFNLTYFIWDLQICSDTAKQLKGAVVVGGWTGFVLGGVLGGFYLSEFSFPTNYLQNLHREYPWWDTAKITPLAK